MHDDSGVGLLGDVLFGLNPLSRTPSGQEHAARLSADGVDAQGRLTGIHVKKRGQEADTNDDWFWGVEVTPPGRDPFTAGLRQAPPPDARDVVRLGAPVRVRTDDATTCVLMWDPSGARDWKPIKSRPSGSATTGSGSSRARRPRLR